MIFTLTSDVEERASQICKAYGLNLNGYLKIAIDRLIEENAIPFPLESEISFSQLKPEVQEGILWANGHRDELPTFKTIEEMNAWLDAEDEKESDLEKG